MLVRVQEHQQIFKDKLNLLKNLFVKIRAHQQIF